MNNEPTLTSLQDFVQTALDQIGKALEGKQVKDFFIPVTFELGIVAGSQILLHIFPCARSAKLLFREYSMPMRRKCQTRA